jgi:DNA-binding NarL/FixJ family response regulator
MIRILLADDHVLVRQGTRQLLEWYPDLEVVGEAGDGKEAITLCDELKPDVVVMDVRMPGLGGLEATRQIKQHWPHIGVLVLSAHDDDEYLFTLLEAGADGYLLKTVEAEELARAIRATHAGQTSLDPSVARKVMQQFAGGHSLAEAISRRREPDMLTEREMEVLRHAGKGLSNKEIGQYLFISDRTVQAHLSNIYGKLKVGSRTEAVMEAVRRGWIEPGEAAP